ncbi:hypothetical protein ACQ4PT_039748 [Festuca glaucescens]
MAPSLATIRDLLTSFSLSSDFLALSSGDGRIKVWDAARGQLQTEFADIPAVEVGALAETKRGHLALDYTCMKWVQLSSKKKRKAGSSLLVLGAGSGDVLALDVAAGQWKWRITDCHPGGVTAVAYSRQGRTVYTAGADGMVCKIDPSDGSVAGKFKSSSKAISALAVSSDGKVLATAAGQLRTFDASDNKKIQKFSGHPVSVSCMGRRIWPLADEFADIPAVEVGALAETKRGHLALDYTCMKWVQLSSKKQQKAGSSLLVLGTGSRDVLALDVAAGQWKWRISDCHPGGVTAVAYSRQGRTVYTAGADGMVCKIDPSDGSVAGKFKSSSKAISALAVSSDGNVLATAAGQLRTFDASDNKNKKFSGHLVAVKTMIFSDNGEYVLSSGVGERYVAIWRLGGGKTQGSSCILSMEHPAIFVDCKCSGINANNGEIHVLAISEVCICYFWSGNSMDDLRNKKPTKIALSESSLSRTKQDSTIFAAKLQGIDGPNSTHVLLAYGSVVKPSFDKLLVCYGKDINLGVSEDGVLLPTIQPTIAKKGQYAKTKGTITALDRANAEDAILPLPKLHTQEKKRKHGVTKPSGDKLAIDSDLGTTARLTEKRVPVQRIEDDSICIEDMLRECGVIDQSIERDPDMATKILSDLFGRSGIPIDANLPSKKIRAHLRSLKPGDACKLLENLVSAWKSRSGSAELVLRWIYCLLVIHGRFISSEKPKKLISNLEKVLFLVTTYQYYLFVSVIRSVDHSKHNPSNKEK